VRKTQGPGGGKTICTVSPCDTWNALTPQTVNRRLPCDLTPLKGRAQRSFGRYCNKMLDHNHQAMYKTDLPLPLRHSPRIIITVSRPSWHSWHVVRFAPLESSAVLLRIQPATFFVTVDGREPSRGQMRRPLIVLLKNLRRQAPKCTQTANTIEYPSAVAIALAGSNRAVKMLMAHDSRVVLRAPNLQNRPARIDQNLV
jgi:hypothetical protein